MFVNFGITFKFGKKRRNLEKPGKVFKYFWVKFQKKL